MMTLNLATRLRANKLIDAVVADYGMAWDEEDPRVQEIHKVYEPVTKQHKSTINPQIRDGIHKRRVEIVRMYYACKTTAEMAKRFDIDRSTVQNDIAIMRTAGKIRGTRVTEYKCGNLRGGLGEITDALGLTRYTMKKRRERGEISCYPTGRMAFIGAMLQEEEE